MDAANSEIDRAPSRVGHRRPPLKRCNASCNAFPHLPLVSDAITPDIELSIDENDDDSIVDLNNELTISLAPLCPPSPPSPDSPSTDDSSSFFSPIDQDEWERFHDGFAPPPIPTQPPVSSWPPTPYPYPPFVHGDPAELVHHGWSHTALYDLKSFWLTRQLPWWHYDEQCRHLSTFSPPHPSDSEDIGFTVFYPPPPVLPRSRRVPWMSANGKPLPSTERMLVRSRPSRELAWPRDRQYFAPIYPRAGDLADLRDPTCEEKDRMFFSVPAYRIRKLVYLTEMAVISGESGLRPRTRHTAARPSASPLAHSWTSDPPASALSQDGPTESAPPLVASVPWPLPYPVSDKSVGIFGDNYALLDTRWKTRWRLISQSFTPPAPPPFSRFNVTLDTQSPPSPPPSPPPRPGTPLPDDETVRLHVDTVDSGDEHAPPDIGTIVLATPAGSSALPSSDAIPSDHTCGIVPDNATVNLPNAAGLQPVTLAMPAPVRPSTSVTVLCSSMERSAAPAPFVESSSFRTDSLGDHDASSGFPSEDQVTVARSVPVVRLPVRTFSPNAIHDLSHSVVQPGE